MYFRNKIIIQMNKKTVKLLHISSQSEEEGTQPNKPSPATTQQKNSLKYTSHKIQSSQMQKNMLFTNQNDHEYYKQQSPSQTQPNPKKTAIKFVDEQYFNVDNHTIIKHRPEIDEKQSSMSILSDLNNINIGENIRNSANTNPELSQLKMTARSKKNILQADFDTDSENQDNQNVPKINVEKSQGENFSSKNQDDGVIKEVEWGYQISQQQFAFKKIKETERLHLVLQRQKSGVNFFLPQFNLLFNNDIRYVLSCKKQIAANFQFIISLDNKSFSEDSPNFVAKIIGNFKNSIYNLIDKNGSIMCTTKFKNENPQAIAPLLYEIFLLNDNFPYFDLVGAKDSNNVGLDELYRIPVNRHHISYFRNKKPEYCQKIGAFMLNFGGRVSEGSIKNFLVQDSKSGRQILMFGKSSNKQCFNLYISAPLNPLLALAIVMPHFATRMLLK